MWVKYRKDESLKNRTTFFAKVDCIAIHIDNDEIGCIGTDGVVHRFHFADLFKFYDENEIESEMVKELDYMIKNKMNIIFGGGEETEKVEEKTEIDGLDFNV